MSPDQDRRQNRPSMSDTAGWHTLEYIVRQALQMQRDSGTPGAVEFLQGLGVHQKVIVRVLAPDAKIRASDQQALDSPVLVADLPIPPRRIFSRRRPK